MATFRKKVYWIIFWLDILVLSLSLLLTVLYTKSFTNEPLNLIDLGLWSFLIAGWYFSSKVNMLYDESVSGGSFIIIVLKILNNVFLQAILLVLFLFVIKYPFYERQFALIYIALITGLLPLEKYLFKKIMVQVNRSGWTTRRVVIVGAGHVGMNFYKFLKDNPHYGYTVVGFLDDQLKPFLNGQYLGNVAHLQQVLRGPEYIDEVVVALPNRASERISEVVEVANNEAVRLRIIPDYFQFLSNKYGFDMFGGFPIITVRHEPLEEMHWKFVKRTFDLVFSVMVLVLVCSWLFPILALIIKLDSKGPVFFKQLRSGRNNKPFYCIKFRSMTINNTDPARQASKNDARVTRIGRILRKTNLDEFPQFINVLMGNMSVVGPRPHMLQHTDQYSKIVRQYMVRQLLKPGITGWAQVNGCRGETKKIEEMQKRVEYDLFYLENWTLLMDVKIIFLTFWNTVRGDDKAF